MNAIIMRNKQNHTSVCWEPFATSTPLKIPPSTLEIENVLRKQLLNAAGISVVDKNQNDFTNSNIFKKKSPDSRHLLSKRARKNTSSAYFDVLTTSSSDEDESNENKKRPIIKLSSRKKTRSLLGSKKFESEDNQSSKITDSKELQTNTEKHAFSAADNCGPEIGQFSNKEKSHCLTERLHCSFSSDDDRKIFDESKSGRNLRSSTKSSSVRNKENLIKLQACNKKLDVSDTQKTEGLPEVNVVPVKSVKRDLFQGAKDSYAAISENNKLSKTPGKKTKKITNMNHPVKKSRSKKCSDKPPVEAVLPVKNVETSLHVWQDKPNLSHQLFSDSKEQEFINLLDLTKEETNDEAEVIKFSVRQKENEVFLKPLVSPHPSLQSTCIDIKHERPKRTKQVPKEFWLPKNTTEKPLLNAAAMNQKQHKAKSKDCVQVQVLKGSEEATIKNNLGDNNKGVGCTVKRQKTVKKNKKVDVMKVKIDEPVLKVEDFKVKKPLSPLPSETKKDAESNQNAFASTADGNTKKLERPVFQRLSDLSCKKNETGCSVEQCWNLHNFKCGVFKLQVKAQFVCETLHRNSHLGGVLVKGALRMKIGEKDLDLKEGDMAFVPPLTKWQAVNIGDCESLFYYWCGRFTG